MEVYLNHENVYLNFPIYEENLERKAVVAFDVRIIIQIIGMIIIKDVWLHRYKMNLYFARTDHNECFLYL